jgi:tetratricopeptide (TPR) repeat protein
MNRTPASSALAPVFALLQDGDTAAASKACEDLLAANGDDVNALALLGAILLKQGNVDAAEQHLLRATELAPGFAKPFEDLGALCLSQHRPEDAAQWFAKAVRLDASQASAHLGLATALERCGKVTEAAAAQQRFLELSPQSKALADAARLFDSGEPAAAEKICGELLIAEPANTRALRLLARIVAAGERFAAAEGLLRRAIDIAPDQHLAYSELAEALATQSRFDEAIGLLEKACALQPIDAALQLRLADALAIMNRPDKALAAYERAAGLAADSLPALLGCAHTLRILGRRDEAIARYRQCVELDATCGDAWWNLASMRGYRFSAADLQKMQSVLVATTDSAVRIRINFALARGFEATEDYGQAWQHYLAGNREQRKQVSYDPVEIETQNDERIRVFARNALTRERPAAGKQPIPVFIVGLPRSGSTLIEQILASHSQVEGCGELPYVIMIAAELAARDGSRYPASVLEMGNTSLQALGDKYLVHSRRHRAQTTPYFTDKMPGNFAHIGLISLLLPDAVIIDARRDPLDTCVANFRQLFAQGKNHSYDLVEVGEYYLEYLRLMEHWDEVLPGRVLRVQYEELVTDLDGQVRRLLAHCGLDFEPACLEFHRSKRAVNTASSEQVRQPIYTDAIGYWRHFEAELDELKQVLGIR